MDTENRLYYFGCMFLHSVLSLFEYLLEDINSPELTQRCRAGIGHLEDLASWLLDELFLAGDREGISEEEASEIYLQGDSFEPLELGWAEKIRSASRDMSEICSSIDEETRLYYFSCGWILRTLFEFDHLLRTIDSVELQDRYQAKRNLFSDSVVWLTNELSPTSIGEQTKAEAKEIELLLSTIENHTEQLAVEWREKVYELARA